MADIATLGLEVDAGGYIRTTEQATRSTRKLAESGDRAERNVRGIGDGADSTARSMRLLKGAVAAVATGFAGLRLAREARDAVLLSARYETLGVVMETVGRNAGRTAAEMREFQRGLEETGISAIQSRNNLARMAGAQIDFAHATDLARIAQNAAVIASTNSSEAFERLITGISTGQRRVLRTMGLFIDFESAINAYAESLGVAADDLTEFERIQARANAVLEGGAQIAGTYEAAMETAGKQLGSMDRLVENLQVALGNVGLAAFTDAIEISSDALKWANENAEILGDGIASLTVALGMSGLAGAFAFLVPRVYAVIRAIALLQVSIGPAGWMVAGITVLTGLIYGWRRAHRGLDQDLRDIAAATRDVTTGIEDMTRAQREAELATVEAALARAEEQKNELISQRFVLDADVFDTEMEVALDLISDLRMRSNALRDALAGVGGTADETARSVNNLAAAYRNAFQAQNQLTPLPDMGIGGAGSTFQFPGGGDGEGSSPSAAQVAGAAASALPGQAGQAAGMLTGIISAFSTSGPLIGGIAFAGTALGALADKFNQGRSALQVFTDAIRSAAFEVEFLDQDPAEAFSSLMSELMDSQAGALFEEFSGIDLSEITRENFDRFAPIIAEALRAMEEWANSLPESVRDDMIAMVDALRTTFGRLKSSADKAAEAMGVFSDNIPRALPLEYLRQQAGMGSVKGPGGGPGGPTWPGWVPTGPGGGRAGGGTVIYQFGDIHTQAADGEQLLTEVEAAVRRRKGQGRSTEFDRHYRRRSD